jgi:hypothetical protein
MSGGEKLLCNPAARFVSHIGISLFRSDIFFIVSREGGSASELLTNAWQARIVLLYTIYIKKIRCYYGKCPQGAAIGWRAEERFWFKRER